MFSHRLRTVNQVLGVWISVALLLGAAVQCPGADESISATLRPQKGVGVAFTDIPQGFFEVGVSLLRPADWLIVTNAESSKWVSKSGDTIWHRASADSEKHEWKGAGVLRDSWPGVLFTGNLTKDSAGSGKPATFNAAVADIDIDVDSLGLHLDGPTGHWPPNGSYEEDDAETGDGTGGLCLPASLWTGAFPEYLPSGTAYKLLVLTLRTHWAGTAATHDGNVGTLTFSREGTGFALYELTGADSGKRVDPTTETRVPSDGFSGKQYAILTNDDFAEPGGITATFVWDSQIKGDYDTAMDHVRLAPLKIWFVDSDENPVSMTASFSHPSPVVELEPITVGNGLTIDWSDESELVATHVQIRGKVYCDIADVAGPAANIGSVTVTVAAANSPEGVLEFIVPVEDISEVPQEQYVPDGENPGCRPFIGAFDTSVTGIALFSGANLVSVEAVNAVGNGGAGSFSILVEHVLDPGATYAGTEVTVSEVENSDRGLFNPIWVYVDDTTGTPSIATFFGHSFELVARGSSPGQYRLNRAFIALAEDATWANGDGFESPPANVCDARTPDMTTALYKGVETQLDWSYTAGSPANYFRYAPGTSVKIKWYSSLLNEGWVVDNAWIEEYRFLGWRRDWEHVHIPILKRKGRYVLPAGCGKNGWEWEVELAPGNGGLAHPRKRMRIRLLRPGSYAQIVSGAAFFATNLKTIIVAVDGLAYDPALSVVSDPSVPYLHKTFASSLNAGSPALAALPTITWANWPSVFSGMPPRETGWTGAAHFARETVIGNRRYPCTSANTPEWGSSGVPLDTRQSIGIVRGGQRGIPDAFNMEARAFDTAGSLYDDIARVGATPTGRSLRACSVRMFYARSMPGTVRMNALRFGPLDPHEHTEAAAQKLDKATGSNALKQWNALRQSVDVLTLYFPGPDNLAHALGGPLDVNTPLPDLRQQVVNVTDAQLGRVVAQIEKDGYLNACLFVLVADHGLIGYRNDPWYNITSESDGRLKMQAVFDALGMRLWRNITGGYWPDPDSFHADVRNSRAVYAPNGGMAQIYLRRANIQDPWQRPPLRQHIHSVAYTVYQDALGLTSNCRELGPRGGGKGALGNPPAIFVRAVTNNVGNHFDTSFQWVKDINSSGMVLGTFEEFVAARQASGSPVDWPEFMERLEEMNHRDPTSSAGSRTGDIILIMNAEEGYHAISQTDTDLEGDHGGPTIGESLVPLMFNMPGPHLVRLDNSGTHPHLIPNNNPQRLHDAVGAKLPSGRMLRNWEMPEILVEIIRRTGTP